MPSSIGCLTIMAFIIGGAILCWSIFVWGVTTASVLLLPILTVISALLIMAFILIVLPLSLLKRLHPQLGMASIIMSKVLGATTWMLSFLYVLQYLGGLGILLAFLFQFLAPIALIGLIWEGDWTAVGNLGLWILFTYGMRTYGARLLPPRPSASKQAPPNDDVIDVEGKVVE